MYNTFAIPCAKATARSTFDCYCNSMSPAVVAHHFHTCMQFSRSHASCNKSYKVLHILMSPFQRFYLPRLYHVATVMA